MEIRARSFIIQDNSVIEFMQKNHIKHIRFIADLNNGEACILVKFPDYSKELTFGKQWMKVIYGKRGVYVRTPSILKPYVGKNIRIYRDIIFGDQFELFRVVPVDFEIKGPFSSNRRLSMNVPYFSKTAYCIIPRKYILEHVGIEIFSSKLSFNRTDALVIDSGYIFCRIFLNNPDNGMLIYTLSRCTNGVRARVKKLSEIVSEAGKDLSNFQYETTIHDSGYDLIVFKEVELGS